MLQSDALEDRLHRLERSNRRLRRALMIWMLLCVAVAVVGAWVNARRSLTARQIRLVDDTGVLRAFLVADSAVPRLAFVDPVSQLPRLELGIDAGNPYVSFLKDHKHLMVLSADNVGPEIRLSDRSGERLSMGMRQTTGEDPFPAIVLRDADGRHRLRLTVRDRGPAVALRDANGANRLDLFAFGESQGIAQYDLEGRERIVLGVKNGEVIVRSVASGASTKPTTQPD